MFVYFTEVTFHPGINAWTTIQDNMVLAHVQHTYYSIDIQPYYTGQMYRQTNDG